MVMGTGTPLRSTMVRWREMLSWYEDQRDTQILLWAPLDFRLHLKYSYRYWFVEDARSSCLCQEIMVVSTFIAMLLHSSPWSIGILVSNNCLVTHTLMVTLFSLCIVGVSVYARLGVFSLISWHYSEKRPVLTYIEEISNERRFEEILRLVGKDLTAQIFYWLKSQVSRDSGE